MLWEQIIEKVEIVSRIRPERKTFFLPNISPILPKGNMKIAVEIRYKLTIQLSCTALAPRSLLIAGSARFTAAPIKGVMKEEKVATIKTDFFRLHGSIGLYSLFFVSIIIVTGPLLTSDISIIAPNSPLPTDFPVSSDNLSIKSLYRGSATAGPAALI